MNCKDCSHRVQYIKEIFLLYSASLVECKKILAELKPNEFLIGIPKTTNIIWFRPEITLHEEDEDMGAIVFRVIPTEKINSKIVYVENKYKSLTMTTALVSDKCETGKSSYVIGVGQKKLQF